MVILLFFSLICDEGHYVFQKETKEQVYFESLLFHAKWEPMSEEDAAINTYLLVGNDMNIH